MHVPLALESHEKGSTGVPLGASTPFRRTESLTSLGLLLDIVLGPALLCLASIVLVLVLGLLGTVAHQTCGGGPKRPGDAIASPRGIVTELAAGFLLLASQVLLTAGLLQALCHQPH